MLESMCHFNIDAFTHYFAIGDVMGPYSRPRASQSYVLKCSDGKWIALHMSSPEKFWQGLARVIEHPSLFDDPRFADRVARIANHEALIKTLAGFFIKRPRAEWAALLEKEDVPYAPMYLVDEAIGDPQFVHLGIETKAEHPTEGTFRSVRSPVSFGGDRTPLAAAPPTLDEHRAAILKEIGR
jgi:crotonobetainyl-CoA:carnitine CoA-transferase CaiB-like acyl-CoA transferase